MKRIITLLAVFVILICFACCVNETLTPAAPPAEPEHVTEVEASTPIPEPTEAPTPTPEPTEAPTPTPEPTEEPTPTPIPPFGMLNNWAFSEPTKLTMATSQFTVAADPEYDPISATLSVSEIVRSAPDEDGYVTYRITCNQSAGISYSYNYIETNDDRFIVKPRSFTLYDYYTGLELYNSDLVTHEDQTVSYIFEEDPDIVTFDGKEYSIWNMRTMSVSWEDWIVDNKTDTRIHIARNANGTSLYIVKAPADYDGLVLGICPGNIPQIDEADPFMAEPKSTRGVYWEGDAKDWVFLRVSELAVDE